MSAILNSFIIPDNIIKKMEDQLEKTRQIGIEHGFNLCATSGNIIDKDDCTGTYCEIKIEKECSDQNITPKVGDYHTHPRGSADMSISDIYMACNFDFKCIGSIRDDSIKCFIRNKTSYPKGCSNEMKRMILEREKLSKNKELLKEELRELSTVIERKNNNYKNLKERLDIKIKDHNKKVMNSIKEIDKIRHKYFKGVKIK